MEKPEGSGLFQVLASLGTFVRVWFGNIAPNGLLRYLLQIFCKLFPWVHFPLPAGRGDVRALPSQSADRLILHAKKRLGVLVRVLFAFVPRRFQRALGYSDTKWRNSVPEEMLRTLVNPCGKGSKRKQDDLALEEQECWVETLQKELSDDDNPEDPSYEPTQLETDSEEYKSQNDTETDLEVEEKDGVVMLKEYPDQKEGPNGEGEKTAAPETGATEGEALELRTSEVGIEDPGWWVLKNIVNESLTSESCTGRTLQSQGPATQPVLGADRPVNSSAQEEWLNLSSE